MGINEYIEHTIREEGREQGIEQGIEKGIEQGIEKGIEQGIEIGAEQMLVKSVERQLQSRLFKKGLMTYEDIAQIQEIEVERVKAIHQAMQQKDSSLDNP